MTQNNSQLMTQNNWRHMFVDAIKSREETLKQKAERDLRTKTQNIFNLLDFYWDEFETKDVSAVRFAEYVRWIEPYEAEVIRYFENVEMQKLKQIIAEMVKNGETIITKEFGNYLLGIRWQILGDEKYYCRNKIFQDLVGNLSPYFYKWYIYNYEQLGEYGNENNYNSYIRPKREEWTSE